MRSHLFFWSLFQPLGLVWSIDAYLQSGKASQVDVPATEWIPFCFCPRAIEESPHPKKEKPVRNTAAPLSAFLILLQLASMYEYTASTKVGESWESGDAVLQTLHLTQYARQPVASILALFPSICRLFTHATLYIEKYGWLLAFLPFQLSRLLAFSMFFGLHFGLNLSLRVGGFQLFVLSAWCVALPRCMLDLLEAQLQRFWPRFAQLLVISQTPVGPSAAKRAMRLGCVTAFNLLGFSLIFLAIAEGCLHRDRNQCAMAPLMRDFGAQQLLKKLDLLQRYNMFSQIPPERPCGYSSMVSWPHPNVRSVSRNFGNIAGSLSYGAIGDSPPARPRCHCRPGIISLHLRGSRWISQRIDGGNWWKKPKRAKALEDTCVPNGKPVTHLPSSCLGCGWCGCPRNGPR